MRPKEEIEVGDLIQVEINGAFALLKPERVRAIQEHDSRRWVFIETSDTGVPMEQAVLVGKGGGDIQPPPPVNAPKLPLQATSIGSVIRRTQEDGDLSVLLTGGGRLQITADVDLAGLERLKEMLGHYESILKLLATPTDRFTKPCPTRSVED